MKQQKLRISSNAAHSLRERLLTGDTLSARDLKMILAILDDVYPRPKRQHFIWWPVFAGMGLGFGIVILLLLAIS